MVSHFVHEIRLFKNKFVPRARLYQCRAITCCFCVCSVLTIAIGGHLPYCLAAGYRKTNLLRELLEAGADVLCLQEMQSDAYHQHFQPQLSEKGYDGLYKAKTREGAMGKV